MASKGLLNIRLKLLTENNVIYAKCEGFETEVFMPVIVNNRISICNVIPTRRCKCITTTHIVAKSANKEKNKNDTLAQWQVFSNTSRRFSVNSMKSPLAESTPTIVKKTFLRKDNMSEETSLDTPDQVRHAVIEKNISIADLPSHRTKLNPIRKKPPNEQVLQNGVTKPATKPNGINMVENSNHYHNAQANLSEIEWPRRTVNNSKSAKLVNGALRVPTPKQVCRALELSNIASGENRKPPNQHSNTGVFLETTQIASKACSNITNELDRLPINSPIKPNWRKVLTPIRTYSRKKHTPIKNKYEERYVPPSLQPNQTEGIKPHKRTIIKHIKTIVDNNVAISPHTFKRQLSTKAPTKGEIRKNYKIRKNELMKKVGFDLLIQPARNPVALAYKLKQQFENRCVNKGTSTYPKYKRLCLISEESKPMLTTKQDKVGCY